MEIKVVTREAFPWGVLCANCKKVIHPGQLYKNRSLTTGKLSTGPCDSDETDGVFCGDC